MATKRSIFEIRYRPLLSVILTTIVLLSAYSISLAFIPLPQSESPSLLGGWIDSFETQYPVWSHIFIWAGVVCISIALAQSASRFNIYGVLTPLPMELYAVLLMIFGVMSLRILLVSVLLLLSMRLFFSSYRASNCAGMLSTAAIYMGVLPLLSPPLIVIWVGIVPIMILIDRSIHEVIVTFVSLLIPLFTYLYIAWFNGGCFVGEFYNFVDTITAGEGVLEYLPIVYTLHQTPLIIVRLVCVALPILLYIISVFAISNIESTVRAKRRVMVVAIYGGAMLIMLSLPSFSFSLLPLLALPLSLIIPIFMVKVSRTVSFVVYALLFVAALFSLAQGVLF